MQQEDPPVSKGRSIRHRESKQVGRGSRRGNSILSKSKPRRDIIKANGDKEGIIEIKKIINPKGTGDPEPSAGPTS